MDVVVSKQGIKHHLRMLPFSAHSTRKAVSIRLTTMQHSDGGKIKQVHRSATRKISLWLVSLFMQLVTDHTRDAFWQLTKIKHSMGTQKWLMNILIKFLQKKTLLTMYNISFWHPESRHFYITSTAFQFSNEFPNQTPYSMEKINYIIPG